MADSEFETLKYYFDRVLYMCITFLLYAISGIMMDLPREVLNWYDFEDDYCLYDRTRPTTATNSSATAAASNSSTVSANSILFDYVFSTILCNF